MDYRSFVGYAFRNAPVYLPIADNRVQQQDGHAHEPDDRQHKCPYIEWVDTGCRIGRKHLPQKGIYCIVDGGDAAVDHRGLTAEEITEIRELIDKAGE